MYEYKANITKVVDGDTVDATVDLGFGIFTILRLGKSKVSKPSTALRKNSLRYLLNALLIVLVFLQTRI